MKPQRKEYRHVSILTIHASGPDFWDMLRYDRCCPATEEESYKINRLVYGSARPEDHIIRLCRYAAAAIPATAGRWKTYGCTVLDERNPDDLQLTDEQLMRMVGR